MPHQPTVFLVDDDEGARKSLGWLIESVGLRVRSFGSAREFLLSYRADMPGCLVLDVRMPRISGLELQTQLNRAQVRIPIIFVSGHGNIAMASVAFRAGAFDFVEKPVNNEELLQRIRQALEKDRQNREEAAAGVAIHQRMRQLTPRERQVMRLLVAGKSIKQIAAHFQISIQTAAKHRSRVLEKMGVDNNVALVHLLNVGKRNAAGT